MKPTSFQTKFLFFSFSMLCIQLLFSLSLKAQKYWQQEVNYTINVTLNDTKHELNGNVNLEYINHSPETLGFIYFHLWPNAYKNNTTAMAQQKLKGRPFNPLFKSSDNNGFMDSIHFTVNGKEVKTEPHPEYNDIVKVILNEPLESGKSVAISTPFHVKIPWGGISRMGHIGKSYQITQWYPKPAVYDATGWHPIPYLDQGEFYSEFGSFDVSITLPKNYVVAATGELQTPSELEWLNQKADADAKLDTFEKSFPLIKSESTFKTIRYTESRVHDFAWFADKTFYVLKGKAVLPVSKDTVTTWSFFPGRVGKFWKNSPEYIRDAITHYSRLLGDYPYKNCTALEGPLGAGGGMEYPGITIVSSGSTVEQLDEVITHEVGHNWLYGILGFNEREYPYLDEGINSFYEIRYMAQKYPESKLPAIMPLPGFFAKLFELNSLPLLSYYELSYLFAAKSNTDQPVNLTSTAYSSINYGIIVYMKSGLLFQYLKNYLGENEFDGIMRKFYETWKFKHPQPDDLKAIFLQYATKDVSWFFNDVLPTAKQLDYKVIRVKNNQLLVKNKGDLNTPFPVNGISNNKIVWGKWFPGFEGKKWLPLPDTSVQKIVIDAAHSTPDIYRNNNSIKTYGLFKKTEPLKLKFLTTFNEEGKTVIQYLPVPAWNTSNKFMLGTLFHNGFLFNKPWEYQLMPLYGFEGQKFAGMGNITKNIFPETGNMRKVSVSISGLQFAYNSEIDFKKVTAGLKILFKNSIPTIFPQNAIELNYSRATDLNKLLNGLQEFSTIFNLYYTYQGPLKINLTKLQFNIKAYNSMARISAEGEYKWKLGSFKSPINLRFYGGYMLKTETGHPFNFAMAGRNGITDLEYEGIFPGRFSETGNITHQFMPVEGGFSVPYPVFADKYLVAAGCNFKISSKGFLSAFNIYGNVAQYKSSDKQDFLYETGISYGIPNLFEVYLPVVFSQNQISYSDYTSLIRFNLNLKLLNLFTLIERVAR